jgi:hypothetical protein
VCRKAPSRPAINRIISKFEMTGTIVKKKKHVVGTKKAATTPENIAHIQ